ncbi:maleylpyruvate isomerase family mycothiol-dependent enzyme [Nocardia takedensis]|uniref:maleylpyruvate isomerase family mycothiol-dependent enzyme n=1 Tax=Nocardia takedensis TaxID=259390 RepID=UPI003F76D5A4
MDLPGLLEQERHEFTELLASLTEDEWSAPSLCAGWRVREVVAHCLNGTVPLPVYTITLARSGFSVDRCNARLIARTQEMSHAEMIDRFAASTGWIARYSTPLALGSLFVHQQDIRRPLGRTREIPADRLLAVLDHPDRFADPDRYTQGLRMEATDVEWARGDGPLVRGPGEAIALAAVGRGAVLADLEEPGVPILRRRCDVARDN